MKTQIPEKYRKEFDISADFAVEKQSFRPSELADHLGTGVLVASILVGYMEKAELVTKGKNDAVRTAMITMSEWDAIGRNIDLYEPKPKISLEDVIPMPITVGNRSISAKADRVFIDEKSITAEELKAIYLHKGFWFFKSYITFSKDAEPPVKPKKRDDTVMFAGREYGNMKQLAERLAERININVIEI